MFGGIGTDAVHFSPYIHNILVTEVDKNTYNYLSKNMVKFNQRGNIQTVPIDCVKVFEYLTADGPVGPITPYPFGRPDVIYFDPPWGDGYLANRTFDFNTVYLNNGTRVVDLLMKIFHKLSKNIIIKSPIKCNTFENLFHVVPGVFITVTEYREYKLKFIFVQNDIRTP